jgi:hypothetical protein
MKTKLQQLGDVAGAPNTVLWRTGLSGAPIDISLPQRLNWWLGTVGTLKQGYPLLQYEDAVHVRLSLATR